MGKRTLKIQLASFHAGEFGECHCCSSASAIRLVGVDKDVSGLAWKVTLSLAQALYQDLYLPEALEKRAALCYGCTFRVRENRHYWLNRDPKDTEGRSVLGPFCYKCLPGQVRALETADGSVQDLIAYEIVFKPKLVAEIQKVMTQVTPRPDSWDIFVDDDLPLF